MWATKATFTVSIIFLGEMQPNGLGSSLVLQGVCRMPMIVAAGVENN
jgi:hypothetical protein